MIRWPGGLDTPTAYEGPCRWTGACRHLLRRRPRRIPTWPTAGTPCPPGSARASWTTSTASRAHAGGGLREPRPALRPAAARLPGARLQLAQGACCRSRRRDFTWSRPTSAATAAPRAGTSTTTTTSRSFSLLNMVRDALGLVVGARLPLGRRSGRARFRLARRRLVRAGAARRVPLGGADERAVRGPAGAAVRHRDTPRRRSRAGRHPRRAGGAAPAAQALPVVLHDARGRTTTCALPAGRARFPARLLPHQERRLDGRTGRSRSRPGPPTSWRSCRATT